jgi:hypothetical protein
MPDETLLALGDLGLDEPRLAEVDARCRAALEREQRPRRRRLRVALPLGAAVLAFSLGAVGYAALSSPEKLSTGIECHQDGSRDGSGAIVAVDGRLATQTCARLSPPGPLHACVDPAGGGAIHVFPGDAGVCARAGLRESPSAGGDAEARRYARFEQPLLAKLNKVDCPSPAQLRGIVQTSLDDARLTGWTILDEGGYSAALPCASLALDSDKRVAMLSPIGR